MTLAQRIVNRVSDRDLPMTAAALLAEGATRTGRFQENQFFEMADGSRLALSDPRNGYRLLHAMPA